MSRFKKEFFANGNKHSSFSSDDSMLKSISNEIRLMEEKVNDSSNWEINLLFGGLNTLEIISYSSSIQSNEYQTTIHQSIIEQYEARRRVSMEPNIVDWESLSSCSNKISLNTIVTNNVEKVDERCSKLYWECSRIL